MVRAHTSTLCAPSTYTTGPDRWGFGAGVRKGRERAGTRGAPRAGPVARGAKDSHEDMSACIELVGVTHYVLILAGLALLTHERD